MSWPVGERCSCPLQFLVVSSLLYLVSTLFSDCRRTVSFKFFDTQVSSLTELMLPRHARCLLSRLRCIGHSLLLSFYLSRIGRIENPSSSASRPRTPFVSFCIVQLRTLRRSLFGDSLFLYDLWSRPWVLARLLVLHGLPPCPYSSERLGNNNKNSLINCTLLLS